MSRLSSSTLASLWQRLPPALVAPVTYLPPLVAGGTGTAVAVGTAQKLPADNSVLPGSGVVLTEEKGTWNLWTQTFSDPAAIVRPGGILVDGKGVRYLIVGVKIKLLGWLFVASYHRQL